MRKRLIVIAVAVAAVVAGGLVAAGWSSSASSSTDLGAAVAVAPANAAAFVAVDSDLSSSQWHAVDGLLGHLPGRDVLLESLRTRFEQRTKLSWADDVEPALGSELDLVVLPGAKPSLVGLTRGGDQAKLDCAAPQARPVDRVGADRRLDGVRADAGRARHGRARDGEARGRRHCIAQPSRSSTATRSSTHMRTAPSAAQLLASVAGPRPPSRSTGRPPMSSRRTSGLRVDALHGGRHGAARPGRLRPSPPGRTSSTRSRRARSLVADFQVTPGAIDFTNPAGLPKALQKVIAGYPSLPSDVQALLGGETAFYVRPGLPIPELTLVTQPADTHAAELALADLEQTLRARAGGVAGRRRAAARPDRARRARRAADRLHVAGGPRRLPLGRPEALRPTRASRPRSRRRGCRARRPASST